MHPRTGSTCFLLVIALAFAGVMPVFAQSPQLTLEQSITNFGRYALTKPSALAVSSNSDRFAVADENLGRVFVFQTDGQLVWIAGETGYLKFPTAVTFEDDVTILVVTKELQLLRVREASPDVCDTVVNLAETTKRSELRRVTHLMVYGDGYLALDPDNGQVVRLDAEWTMDRVLIPHGRTKGKVWSPTDMERDMSGKLIVSDRGDYPLQVFSKTGSFLFSADWNAPDRQRTWEASAVAVTRQETIWTSDITDRRWRMYDQTGTLVVELAFSPPGLLPFEVSATVDSRLIVLEERGTLSIWSLIP